jgi:hypothetical protein
MAKAKAIQVFVSPDAGYMPEDGQRSFWATPSDLESLKAAASDLLSSGFDFTCFWDDDFETVEDTSGVGAILTYALSAWTGGAASHDPDCAEIRGILARHNLAMDAGGAIGRLTAMAR